MRVIMFLSTPLSFNNGLFSLQNVLLLFPITIFIIPRARVLQFVDSLPPTAQTMMLAFAFVYYSTALLA